MQSLETNRDLYQAVARLIEAQRNKNRSLEEYLRALLGLVERYRDRESLSPREFLDLITDAFTAEPAPRDDAWLKRPPADIASDHEAVREVLIEQIVDLIQMEQAGTLEDDQRYFGVNAPSGARWYNFDPCTFLECGMAGTIGGWEPSDDTGRELVPGPVAVMDQEGHINAVDPEEIEEPIVAIPEISWELLEEFLRAGQQYE